MKKFFLIVSYFVITGCASTEPRYQVPENNTNTSTAYQRGNTNYNQGNATVNQPDITVTNDRNFDGLRVAGNDTDLITAYWDSILRIKGKRIVFNTFRNRYKDLIVYGSGAQDSALREFRIWSKTHNIQDEFNSYWLN